MLTTRLRDEIDHAATVLAEAGVPSPRGDAEELAAFAAGTSRWRLAMLEEPDDQFFGRYSDLVTARAGRIPLQHLIGTAAFGPVTLSVGPGVFIPRPETESLLDWAMKLTLPPEPVVVDLCTGSGALAVALARHWPAARVVAVDNSMAALDYARRNVVGTRVELLRRDVNDPAPLLDLEARVDLLVANPPYLPDGARVEPEVAEHDPREALFGGPDGMAIIVSIIRLAGRLLRPGGVIAVEHDESTSTKTVELFSAAGVYDEVTPRKDLVGRPRFVIARRRAS